MAKTKTPTKAPAKKPATAKKKAAPKARTAPAAKAAEPAPEPKPVIAPDHVHTALEPAREPTKAAVRAFEDHVEIRVAELVNFARQEGAMFGADPRALASLICRQVYAALDPDDEG